MRPLSALWMVIWINALVMAAFAVKLHITVSGKKQESIDLSEWPVDNKPTIGCSATTVHPAAQLHFELNGQNLKTWPFTQINEDRNRSTTFISWRDDQQQLTNGLWLACVAQHPSYTGEFEWTYLYIMGQYAPKATPSRNIGPTTTNWALQAQNSTTTPDKSTRQATTKQPKPATTTQPTVLSHLPVITVSGQKLEQGILNLTAISSSDGPLASSIECSMVHWSTNIQLYFQLYINKTWMKLLLPAERIEMSDGMINTSISLPLNAIQLAKVNNLCCWAWKDDCKEMWRSSCNVTFAGQYQQESFTAMLPKIAALEVMSTTLNVGVVSALGCATTLLLVILATLPVVRFIRKRTSYLSQPNNSIFPSPPRRTAAYITTIYSDGDSLPHPGLISTHQPAWLQNDQQTQDIIKESQVPFRAHISSHEATRSSMDDDGYLLPNTVVHFSQNVANQNIESATDEENTYQ